MKFPRPFFSTFNLSIRYIRFSVTQKIYRTESSEKVYVKQASVPENNRVSFDPIGKGDLATGKIADNHGINQQEGTAQIMAKKKQRLEK